MKLPLASSLEFFDALKNKNYPTMKELLILNRNLAITYDDQGLLALQYIIRDISDLYFMDKNAALKDVITLILKYGMMHYDTSIQMEIISNPYNHKIIECIPEYHINNIASQTLFQTMVQNYYSSSCNKSLESFLRKGFNIFNIHGLSIVDLSYQFPSFRAQGLIDDVIKYLPNINIKNTQSKNLLDIIIETPLPSMYYTKETQDIWFKALIINGVEINDSPTLSYYEYLSAATKFDTLFKKKLDDKIVITDKYYDIYQRSINKLKACTKEEARKFAENVVISHNEGYLDEAWYMVLKNLDAVKDYYKELNKVLNEIHSDRESYISELPDDVLDHVKKYLEGFFLDKPETKDFILGEVEDLYDYLLSQ